MTIATTPTRPPPAPRVDTSVAVTLKAAVYSPGLGRANTVIGRTTQVAHGTGAR